MKLRMQMQSLNDYTEIGVFQEVWILYRSLQAPDFEPHGQLLLKAYKRQMKTELSLLARYPKSFLFQQCF